MLAAVADPIVLLVLVAKEVAGTVPMTQLQLKTEARILAAGGEAVLFHAERVQAAQASSSFATGSDLSPSVPD